jgi:hypothetical protein
MQNYLWADTFMFIHHSDLYGSKLSNGFEGAKFVSMRNQFLLSVFPLSIFLELNFFPELKL